MMKLKLISGILFYSICILPTACSSDKSENTLEFVLVAFRGFCFRDSTGKIYNIEDLDSLNTYGLYYDSTLLDITRYFELKNTRIRCVRKLWGKPFEYFEPSSHDTIGLFKRMQLLSASILTSEYLCPEAGGMSNEYGYAFITSRQSESQEHYILYNPACLPDTLKALHVQIHNILMNENPRYIKPFGYHRPTRKFALRLYESSPPPVMIPPVSSSELLFLSDEK